MQDGLNSLPGVEAVSLVAAARPMRTDSELPFWIEGEPKPAAHSDMKLTQLYIVGPDYLKVMGIPLIRGRFLTATDHEHSSRVAVIDDRFAQLCFGDRDPIGQRVNIALLNISAQIVGVVGHVTQWGLDGDTGAAVQAQCYLPLFQLPNHVMPMMAGGIGITTRTSGPPLALVGSIGHALTQVNARQVMYGAETMDEIIAGSLADRRFSMILLMAFAALALLMSCVGIYGVISCLAGQRTHEIGIRMALGAGRLEVLRMVLGQGARMALAGVAAGLIAAFGLTRLMENMLFGVSAHDPLTLASVAAILILVALAACCIPARRATRVDPIIALRHE